MKFMKKGLFFVLALMIMGCNVQKSVSHIYYVKKMIYEATPEGLTSDDALNRYEVDIHYNQNVIKEETKQDVEQYYLSYTRPELVSHYLLDFDLNSADIHVLLDHDVIMKYSKIEMHIGNEVFSYQYEIKNDRIIQASGTDELGSFTHKYSYDHSGHLTRIERLYDHGESDAIMIGWKDDKVVNMKDDEDDVTYTYKNDHLASSSNHVSYHYKDDRLVSFKQDDDYEVKYTYKNLKMKQEVFNNKELLETYHYEYKKIK
jgi:hypothetical protein